MKIIFSYLYTPRDIHPTISKIEDENNNHENNTVQQCMYIGFDLYLLSKSKIYVLGIYHCKQQATLSNK